MPGKKRGQGRKGDREEKGTFYFFLDGDVWSR
jgi:hypothetical protein